MNLYVDIDETICRLDTKIEDTEARYRSAMPIYERIEKVNKLFDEGNTVVYWTARGNASKKDFRQLTLEQLDRWGCKYTRLDCTKPSFDLFIDDKVQNVNTYWPHYIHSTKKQSCEQVKKGWGSETIFINNAKYCGKLLNFNKDAKFSMHFHIKKEETWYVLSGKFTYRWINTVNADINSEVLLPGDVITNAIGEPHQIVCEETGTILEVSTTHYDEDSYRVMKGDSQ